MNCSVIVLCIRKENSSCCLDSNESHYVNIIFAKDAVSSFLNHVQEGLGILE